MEFPLTGIAEQGRRSKSVPLRLGVIVLGLTLVGCSDGDSIPLRVNLGARSVSKLPFVIAWDQGLYAKHGLDVRLDMPPPDFDGGIEVNADGLLARTWRRLRFREPPPFDILVDGGTPYMVLHTLSAREPRRIALAGTDCVVRAHIVARQGISIMLNGRDVAALRAGLVDAIVAAERAFAAVRQEDFSVLEDTRTWTEAVAGNSVLVQPEWLEDPMHREAARRFLMATVEAISLFHQDRELALAVLEEWNGVPDQDFAETMYERGAWTPRAPFPCYEGITRTMEMYDSNEMRRYAPEDFYDDSLMREIVESGFVDGLYR
jgi:hypothetical protein